MKKLTTLTSSPGAEGLQRSIHTTGKPKSFNEKGYAIFLPNDKNLTLAFEGTDLEFTARNVAKKLLNDHVITRTPLTGDVFTYCCHNTGPDIDKLLHMEFLSEFFRI